MNKIFLLGLIGIVVLFLITPAFALTGDVNGDGVVNLKDIAIAARALGSHCANHDYAGQPASTNWNPACDLNGDGVVNMQDLMIVARNFGY